MKIKLLKLLTIFIFILNVSANSITAVNPNGNQAEAAVTQTACDSSVTSGEEDDRPVRP